ncbi:alpha/beta hydrolase [Variovorax sp. RKNM96]|uniref:alpha/beta hydrolase n=1 Tax=Variovorax sp. RKNM96 TaxID=2681552 RepID=UPI00198078C7|nr:alpha/beta hydrolase [Variovorax sp. RKNM96]
MVDSKSSAHTRGHERLVDGARIKALLRMALVWACPVAVLALAGCTTPKIENPPEFATVAKQGVLFVGGKYKSDPAQGMTDQAYVFYQIPKGYAPGRDGKWPIIMVHGSEQTGANFLGTPDGRPGWVWYFVSQGWPVYVIDQPGHGKSGYFPETYGVQAASPQPARVQGLFAGPELTQPTAWPEAPLHTQWPGGAGSGKRGNEAFDQFMASQVANVPEHKRALALTRRALGELLGRIGPSILVTHSMAGPLSWMVPQDNPGKIKAVIAIEPTGNSSLRGDAAPGSPCGLTDECLRFSPAIESPADLGLVKTPSPIAGLQSCWLQTPPARTLADLAGLPILIATSEASYHAQYDHCTSLFLSQAGVTNTWINLASVGIRGNGHMQMLELNNLEIANFYKNWILRHVR